MENSENEATPKKKGSFKKRIALASIAALIAVSAANAAAPKDDTPSQQAQASAKVRTELTSESETIPFQTKIEDDATLPLGQTNVAQEGKSGTKTTHYELSFTDDIQTDKKQVGESTITQPVDKVVKHGTYLAPPPAPATSAPAPAAPSSGATAMCNDGTYSYSAHRQGTCSHHGGVAVWY